MDRELLPAASLQPCADGGDICSLAGLTWPMYIPSTMSSWQYRDGHPSARLPCAEAPHPLVYLSSQWVCIRALPVHSLPTIPHYIFSCFYCAP